MENKEAAFVCTQCGADVNFCDVDSVLGHPMPTFDDDGDVDGCYQCGPCKIKTEWALAHMAKQEADLMSSASHISALEAKCSDLEQQLAQMTAERDSESRWAKEYFNRFNVLEERYSIFEEMAPPDISRKEFAEMCFNAWEEKQASNA